MAPVSETKKVKPATAPKTGGNVGKSKAKPGKPRYDKRAQKNAKVSAKRKIEDLSESDIDSDEDFGLTGPEFGPLSDTSSSDGEYNSSEEHDQHAVPPSKPDASDDEESDEGVEDEEEEDTGGSEDEGSSSGEEVPEPEGPVEGDTSEDEDSNAKKRPKLDPERENRTIFVGNLPYNVKKMKLKKAFSKFGAVETVRLRCAPIANPEVPKKVCAMQKDFHTERTNISAFVRFVDASSVDQALSSNGAPWDETHHIRVDRANASLSQHDDKKAVFIGNLPFDAEEDQIREIFLDCGDIASIRIVRDRRTNVGKGFAFVNFAQRHSVSLALQKNKEKLGKREIRVDRCNYKQARQEPRDAKQKSANFILKRKEHVKKMFPKSKKKKPEEDGKPSYQGESAEMRQKRQKKKKNRKASVQEAKAKKLREVLSSAKKHGRG